MLAFGRWEEGSRHPKNQTITATNTVKLDSTSSIQRNDQQNKFQFPDRAPLGRILSAFCQVSLKKNKTTEYLHVYNFFL